MTLLFFQPSSGVAIVLPAFLSAITFVVLLFAAYTDLKTREVPDWVNFSFLGVALIIRLLLSWLLADWHPLLEGLFGIALGFLFASLFFYTGQWGGGDGKLLIAMGASLGFWPTISHSSIAFLVNLLLAGAVYGFFYSIWLAMSNRTAFLAELHSFLKTPKIRWMRRGMHVVALGSIVLLIFLSSSFVRILLSLLLALIIFLFYGWIFSSVLEKSCLLRRVHPQQITPGDWIAEDVHVGGKRICGPSDLGIEEHQIQELIKLNKQKKVGLVIVKYGIPFVPAFLLGFLMMLWFGNPLLLFL